MKGFPIILGLLLCLCGCGTDRLADSRANWQQDMLTVSSRAADHHSQTNELLQELIQLQKSAGPTLATDGPVASPEALSVSTTTPEAGAEDGDADNPAEETAGADEPPDDPGLADATGTDAGITEPEEMYHVYRVRLRYGNQEYGGSCVSIGGGRFLTAAHLAQGVRGRFTCEVQIAGDWVRCGFTPWAGRDLAELTSNVEVPGHRIAAPEYGLAAAIYGRKTDVVQPGRLVVTGQPDGAEALAVLDADCHGIEQGDSGGGVFDEDGQLVGVIIRRNSHEHRLVTMACIHDLPLAAQDTRAAVGKPRLWITYAPSYVICKPCNELKAAIAAGEFDAFEIKTLKDTGRVRGWPAIEFTDSNGLRKVLYRRRGESIANQIARLRLDAR